MGPTITTTRPPADPFAATDLDRPDRAARADEAGLDWPDRPDRPATVELAAAVVLVNGIFRLVVLALAATGQQPIDPIPPLELLIEIALPVTLIGVAILVRTGRAWVLDINVLAVVTFLQAFGLSAIGLTFALVYGLAFVLVFRARPWFEAMAAWRAATDARAADRRRP